MMVSTRASTLIRMKTKGTPCSLAVLLAGYLPQAFKVAVIKALLKKFLFVPAVVTNYRLFLIFLLVQRILKD